MAFFKEEHFISPKGILLVWTLKEIAKEMGEDNIDASVEANNEVTP